jgi:protein kinase A
MLVVVSRFEKYPEDNVAASYGQPVQDEYGEMFPDFEYASM